jgi:hypothetical protein
MVRKLRNLGMATAAMVFIQVVAAGAYWVCDRCGCHVNHQNCWFYDHDDVCNSAAGKSNCYMHPENSCLDDGAPIEEG